MYIVAVVYKMNKSRDWYDNGEKILSDTSWCNLLSIIYVCYYYECSFFVVLSKVSAASSRPSGIIIFKFQVFAFHSRFKYNYAFGPCYTRHLSVLWCSRWLCLRLGCRMVSGNSSLFSHKAVAWLLQKGYYSSPTWEWIGMITIFSAIFFNSFYWAGNIIYSKSFNWNKRLLITWKAVKCCWLKDWIFCKLWRLQWMMIIHPSIEFNFS